MIDLELGEFTEIVSGRLLLGSSGASVHTVVNGAVDTDSRLIEPGGIFVAKPGVVTDGHLFAPDAIANGAALLLVERELDVTVPQIVVADVVTALADLARHVVARVRAQGTLTVIGITGSNGKTTTKNLVAAMCAQHGETVWPRDSFNNEVGAPLTMLKVTFDTKFLVLELGASGIGHIARLTGIVQPDIGVVLMVGLAHAGEFGGVESTVIAKRELVETLVDDGVAILNCDDPRVVEMAGSAPAEVLWFGYGTQASVSASDVRTSLAGTSFVLHAPDGSVHPVAFRVMGEHHVMNALAAASVGFALGFDATSILAALESVTRAEHWRMEVMGNSDVVVINDAYNASPDSMAAALKTLRLVAGEHNRTIAVLGEMSELGEYAGEEYDRLALLLVRLNIDLLVVIGTGARRLHISAMNEGSWDGESVFYENTDDAYDYLHGMLRPGDIVLVKSSNSAGLRFLGDRLGEAYA